ncbi:hypothetical protein ACOMHN_056423 [Nucella lapillus]
MADSSWAGGRLTTTTGWTEKAGDKLSNKQKDIMRVQKSLLSRNIVWSSALAARLKERHLLTDAMITQIDATQGRENKILVLLDLIPLRTSKVYDKFADALHLSGHSLVADFLRDEDVSQHPLNVGDLFESLPFLEPNLKDKDRSAIEEYMLEKIQSCELAHVWQWNTKDKDKALVSKMDQQEVKEKEKQVLEAERVAKEAREETLALKAELRAMSDSANRQQQQIKGQLDTQMRFSVANDNISQRLSQRLKTTEQTLKTIQETLQATTKLAPRNQEQDLMKLADNAFYFLPEDVETFSSQFQKLRHLQTKYEKLVEECNGIITELGFPKTKDPDKVSVLKVFHDFANRKEEEVLKLRREVTRQEQLVEDVTKAKQVEERKLVTAGTVWQNAILSVRKQLQDLKTSIRKKETTIIMKEEDLVKLRGKVSGLESSLTSKTKEAKDAMIALKLAELQSNSLPSDLKISSTTTAAPDNTSKVQTLPSLPQAVAGPQTTPSPKPARNNTLRHSYHTALPGGLVVEADTQLDMYPVGLSTRPLGVGAQRGEESSRQPLPAADAKNRSLMKASLGDFRSLHVHSKYPSVASRGGGGGGGGGMGLDSPAGNHHKRNSMSRSGGGAGLDNSGYLNKNYKRKHPPRV